MCLAQRTALIKPRPCLIKILPHPCSPPMLPPLQQTTTQVGRE
jgi:hypothetical protein